MNDTLLGVSEVKRMLVGGTTTGLAGGRHTHRQGEPGLVKANRQRTGLESKVMYRGRRELGGNMAVVDSDGTCGGSEGEGGTAPVAIQSVDVDLVGSARLQTCRIHTDVT